MKFRNLFTAAAAIGVLVTAAGYNLLSADVGSFSTVLGTPDAKTVKAAQSARALDLNFTQDGRQLVAYQANGEIISWNLETGKPRKIADGVTLFAMCPSKDLMLKAKGDGTLAVETLGGKVITLLEVGEIEYAAWSEDCSRFVLAPKDKNLVEVWHGEQIYPVASAQTSMPVRNGVALSVDGTQVVAGVGSGSNTTGHRTVIETFAPKADGQLARRAVYSAANGEAGNWKMVFSPVSSRLYVGSQVAGKSGLRSFETNSGSEDWHQANFVAPWVRALAVSPDGAQLVSGDEKGNLQVWDAATGKKLNSYKTGLAVQAVSYARDSRKLAVAAADGTIRVIGLKGRPGAGS